MKNAAIVLGIVFCGGLLVVGQQSPLDRPLGKRFMVLLPPASAETRHAAISIAQTARVVAGVEEKTPRRVPIDGRREPRWFREDLTARQALDLLVMLDPDYSWQEMDGVAVFRPLNAWKDDNDILNRRIQAVNSKNTTASQAADVLTNILFDTPTLAIKQNGERVFSMTFAGGTVIDYLNNVITAHGEMTWNVQEDSRLPEHGLILTFQEFDGGHVSTRWTNAR